MEMKLAFIYGTMIEIFLESRRNERESKRLSIELYIYVEMGGFELNRLPFKNVTKLGIKL